MLGIISDNISTANLYNINSSIVLSTVWNELAYIISLEFSGNQGLFRALYFTTLLLKTMNFMLTIYSSERNSKNTNMLQFETFWIGIKHLERRKWKLILLICIWFLYIFSYFEKVENDICKELVNVEVLYFTWLIQHPWKMVLPICYAEQSGDMHVLDTGELMDQAWKKLFLNCALVRLWSCSKISKECCCLFHRTTACCFDILVVISIWLM